MCIIILLLLILIGEIVIIIQISRKRRVKEIRKIMFEIENGL